MKRVAVIGGGASGLAAAYFAAKKGCEVVLFERQKKLGRKILVTGNGRCNISNLDQDVSHYHGGNTKFAHQVLSRFGLEETRLFFMSLGIPFAEEKNGRLYPASFQSSAVPLILSYELKKRNVDIRLHRKIDSITPGKKGFTLTTAGKEKHDFDSVIVSAGSCAAPQIGGSDSGYELISSSGHTVHEPFPAITPINIPLKILHRLQGIKWDCSVKAVFSNRVLGSSTDELLFTGYGISGPAALNISRFVKIGRAHV